MDSSAFQIGQIFGALFGATVVACVLGGSAAVIAQRNGQTGFAVISFLACFSAGWIGGLILGVPVFLLFAGFSWVLEGFSESHQSSGKQVKGERSPVLFWGVIFGLLVVVFCSAAGAFIFGRKAPGEPFRDASIRMVKEMIVKEESESSSQPKRLISETKMRTFESSDGRIMMAHLISFDGEMVEIVREDGRPFSTSISLFSEKDQNYIRSFF